MPPAVQVLTLSEDEIVLGSLRALSCQDGGLGIFRLVHLLDAIYKCPQPPKRIISIGSGQGYHEVILAKLFPAATVTAIDIQKQSHAYASPNLVTLQGDILNSKFINEVERADFVYSIECLEHIKEDAIAFAAMAEIACRGGRFYIEIPYSTEWERNDQATVEREFAAFEHFTPGYDAGQLFKLAADSSLEVISVHNVFWAPLQPMLTGAIEKFGPEVIHRYLNELLELLMTDFKQELATHRGQCTGIKMLTQK